MLIMELWFSTFNIPTSQFRYYPNFKHLYSVVSSSKILLAKLGISLAKMPGLHNILNLAFLVHEEEMFEGRKSRVGLFAVGRLVM